jgi:hypothetical protein
MSVWYSLWSFGVFFPIWYVWTKKNPATLVMSSNGRKSIFVSGTFKKNAVLKMYFLMTRPTKRRTPVFSITKDQGCQMFFSNQKFQFWVNFRVPWVGKCCYILWPFGIF